MSSFSFTDFFIMVGIFIFLMILFKRSDSFVKRLKPSTVKTLNWIGFILGAVAGVAWYLTSNNIFMLLTFLGIILYFLFYGYDKMEEEEGKDS